MRAATICKYGEGVISVAEAKEIQEPFDIDVRQTMFECLYCGRFVEPHLGQVATPHFEHVNGQNVGCPIGHLQSPNVRPATRVRRDFDDEGTIEGAKKDAQHQITERDRALANECKRLAGYKCQACGFYLKVGKRYVIDAHHKYPVSLGQRNTIISDLIALCPTCHRIAHTAESPLDLDAIRALVGLQKN